MFELQNYRGVIFHDTEEISKIWWKTDLWFEKRLEKFGKFSPEHFKVSKLGLWWDPFVQSRKCMALKFAEELCVMTMKNAKIWRGIDLSFQNWHEKLNEFWLEHSKIQKNCSLIGSFDNSKFNRTFYTCLTESSLFLGLRYK